MILLITDLGPNDSESAVEGIFERRLVPEGRAIIVLFSSKTDSILVETGKIILPKRYKHRAIAGVLEEFVTKNEVTEVIVRNWFSVLKQLLKAPWRPSVKLGFWETFPHSYRRLHEAEQEGRALWRKKTEYIWRCFVENRLLSQSDFILPISNGFMKEFRPKLKIPHLIVPMGIDPDCIPAPTKKLTSGGPLRLIYIGACDPLRNLGPLIKAVKSMPSVVTLDIRTSQQDYAKSITEGASNIRTLPPLPRDKLLKELSSYDLGISTIPINRLYEISSPTKTLEYYACGLPCLLSNLPEHRALFSQSEAFFCNVEADSIADSLSRAAELPREDLRRMGIAGRDIVLRERSYKKITLSLEEFLKPESIS